MNNSATEEQAPSSLMAGVRFARALLDLTKPKIAIASVITALAAYVAVAETISLSATLLLLLASGLAAGGSLAFNQWWERDSDPLMHRTQSRPLPQKIISPTCALAYSIVLSLTGCALLWAAFGALTALFGVATVLIYTLLYTPLKRRSRWATEVGSISGALPPLLGAAAAGNIVAPSAWLLAVALFFWQMPHFYAIGWIYRDDYRAAKLPLLPAADPEGRRTGLWMLIYSSLLILCLLLPWSMGWLFTFGGAIALAGSLMVLIRSWKFYAASPQNRINAARRLFHASLFALPALLFVAFS